MSKPYVVGIDIGGTNTVFGIVDARGSILATGSIKTQKYTEITDYVNALHEELSRLLAQENVTDQIAGIGIGAPNGNYFNGTIEFAPNLPWKGVIPLAQMVREKFNIPVTITNDANAAAIGEMTYGAARGVKDFIMITLGTGVLSTIFSSSSLGVPFLVEMIMGGRSFPVCFTSRYAPYWSRRCAAAAPARCRRAGSPAGLRR